MNINLKQLIEKKLTDGSLVVLKGYDVREYGIENFDITNVIKDKLSFLTKINSMDKKVVSFDVFVALYQLIMIQFPRVTIIENPLFYNLYPFVSKMDENVLQGLLLHFDEEIPSEDDVVIGDLDDYTSIFSNIIKTKTGIACCYNIDENELSNEKIERTGISISRKPLSKLQQDGGEHVFINICDEDDYYDFVINLFNNNLKYAVNYESFKLERNIIQKRLELLNSEFEERIYENGLKDAEAKKEVDPVIKEIMKKYWGYENFREIKVYNTRALENKQKEISVISQYNIISDIIEQAENCKHGKEFSDIFVTAPTGAGKSLMFQIPAIYLAEKYNLVTLVISPLIGLMQDQVAHLKEKGYDCAETINSDISPVVKQEILEKVNNGECHILYLSPESLLSRGDIEALIGNRRIGMVVIDEAHIVTTWGKQFRPDYWYLGNHISKLKKAQQEKKEDPASFIISTFTATATYGGNEDMYKETINSLQMIEPITYLGYLKRVNIDIDVKVVEKGEKQEYEFEKFERMVKILDKAISKNKKVLVYFPTVALIGRFEEYIKGTTPLGPFVSAYNGQMDADKKNENFEKFKSGETPIMLATKAFGMGIDIEDISVVLHYAPTGNVCDYMQEIGRAARRLSIEGTAIYEHFAKDFKYINQLHGMSAIRKFQLVEVIKKVLEIYLQERYKKGGCKTKKRNELLVDAENFHYIFADKDSDEDVTNKVKTAMLMIQKDFERRGYAPFYMRPIPMFAEGYFAVNVQDQKKFMFKYKNSLQVKYPPLDICNVNLKNIWEKEYKNKMSFPKFKFMLYSNSDKLDFNQRFKIKPAWAINIELSNDYESIYFKYIAAISSLIKHSVLKGKFIPYKDDAREDLVNSMVKTCKISVSKAESMVSVLIAGMSLYGRYYVRPIGTNLFNARSFGDNSPSYLFNSSVFGFFKWLYNMLEKIQSNLVDGYLYVIKNDNKIPNQEIVALGILEALGVLKFNSLGGSNSQLYIYVNETKTMRMIKENPAKYQNSLLNTIAVRHKEAVEMLSYLYTSGFTSDQIWEELENYFLGILPAKITNDYKEHEVKIEVEDKSLRFDEGEPLLPEYPDWDSILDVIALKDSEQIKSSGIPLATNYASRITLGDISAEIYLSWNDLQVAITDGDEGEAFRAAAADKGWICIPEDEVTANRLIEALKR